MADDEDPEVTPLPRPCLQSSLRAVHAALIDACEDVKRCAPDDGIRLAARIEVLARAVVSLESLRRAAT